MPLFLVKDGRAVEHKAGDPLPPAHGSWRIVTGSDPEDALRRVAVIARIKSQPDEDLGGSAAPQAPDGHAFEVAVMSWLRREGATDVGGTGGPGDQGADVLFIYDGRRFVVQCKRYAGSVGNRAVQEAHGARAFYARDRAWVVTTGTFTAGARALAQRTDVVLVDRATQDRIRAALEASRRAPAHK